MHACLSTAVLLDRIIALVDEGYSTGELDTRINDYNSSWDNHHCC